VFPLADSVKPSEQQALAAANNRLLSYGSPRFDKYLDPTKFGPGLGSAGLEAREKRFGKGFGASDVGRAMRCASCHRPEQLGALSWPLDSVVVDSYVNGGQMPFGGKLEESQRHELRAKLVEEYFAIDDANPGILKSWLMGKNR
jgi:hypothetical protein